MAVALELVVVGDDDFPEVGLPEAVDAEVADFAGRLHLAVDRGREGLELADDSPEVHLVVGRTFFDLDDEVDVIGHDDIFVELHFGIEPRHVGDGPGDAAAEFVQRDAVGCRDMHIAELYQNRRSWPLTEAAEGAIISDTYE